MKSELTLTRRDVAAVVIYATLGYNVLNALFYLFGQLVLPLTPYFRSSLPTGTLQSYGVNLGVNVVFALAFLPFVSLMASGVAGRNLKPTVAQGDILWLTFSCIGLVMFLASFPVFARFFYNYLTTPALTNSSGPTLRAIYLQFVIITLASVSVGFALAFFPAIFGTLRARARDEDSAVVGNLAADNQPDEL